MNVRTDIVQLDRAIQNGAIRGFEDTQHFLGWMTNEVKELVKTIDHEGQVALSKQQSVLLVVEKNDNIFDVQVYIDPSFGALTCPVIETLEEFSLV